MVEEKEWEGEVDAEGDGEESWSRGDWSKDRRGNWQWSMDFTSGKAADAAPLKARRGPGKGLADVVAAAVQAAVAGTQAKPTPLARAPAPAEGSDPRARLRELDLELASFRQEHGL